MTLILKQLFNFIKVLNSDTGEKQIACGIACGLILGFAPVLSLQSLLVFIIIFLFRVQAGAAFASAFFFALVAFILDPVFDIFGAWILDLDSLQGLFTTMYNMPIIPFTKFYNTIVMGAGVVSLLLFPLAYILGKKFTLKYRVVVVARLENTKAFKALKATSLYKWYAKYNEYYG
ncbi:MAG: TIGR03546 family protein [Halobacteriovoraceae bacterium]|nr:TIGR03546 family protein [Halobacteriovoraceae bacterium]|tara:strand:+ start:17647 stop:18171 length:525 start_codon:yes stop_codon:yes gene_type:complete